MHTIPTATPPQPRPRRRSTWLAVGLVATTLLALGVGIAVFRGNDSPSTATAASQQLASAQLTSMQQSCQQWSGNSASALVQSSPSATWCTTMTDWMGQQLRSGRMTGATMWGSATMLQATCQQWMAAAPGSAGGGTASPAWCGQMAGGMAQRVGNWGNWMMNGNMMGR